MRNQQPSATPNPYGAPRTLDERLSFISGYAQAVIDIHHHDLNFARRWLLKMVGLEIEPPPTRRRRRIGR